MKLSAVINWKKVEPAAAVTGAVTSG